MNDTTFNGYLKRLSLASERNFTDPGLLEWPDDVDGSAWYFSPELISLFGTPAWNALDELACKRLSFFEAVNFFSLNIHGEKYLISEISQDLYQGEELELSRYLLHFLEEEARHMMYFSGFCSRYAGKVYPDRTVQLADKEEGDLRRFLLFLRIYLFEEIVDEYNLIMAKDERLSPIVREINRIHHVEESRHLAFGRKFIQQQLDQGIVEEEKLAEVRAHLSGFHHLTWKQYYNPDVYKDAGLTDAFGLWQEVFDAPACRRHRNAIGEKRLLLLRQLKLLEPVS